MIQKCDLESLSYQQLREIKLLAERLMIEKSDAARREYEERVAAIASEYGYRPTRIAGRPRGARSRKGREDGREEGGLTVLNSRPVKFGA